MNRIKRLVPVMVAHALIAAQPVLAQNAVIATNIPETIFTPISTGSQSVTIPFAVSGCSAVRLDVIVPVDGPAFSVKNPSAVSVIAPGDPSVQFLPGATLQPGSGLPGGIFATEEIVNPPAGTWTIQLGFPAAGADTVAVTTVFCKSHYQVGIAIERTRFVTGEDVSVGLLVLAGDDPVTGLSPSLTIGLKQQPATAVTLVGRDDGQGPDGQAGDGIYSVDMTFGQPGTYEIVGVADIPGTNGVVHKTARQVVQVEDPNLAVTQITTGTQSGPGGCIAAATVNFAANVHFGGQFLTIARLRAANGNESEARSTDTLAAGANLVTVLFPAEQLKGLGVDGPYRIRSASIHEVKDDGLVVAFTGADLGDTAVLQASALCTAAIELAGPVRTSLSLDDNFISSVTLHIPIRVETAGQYSLSFKVVSAEGEDIGLFTDSVFLPARETTDVEYVIPAASFLNADGPYSVVSLLVLGGGKSFQLARVGVTDALARWQFLPSLKGDLDNDGDVDHADLDVLSQFSGQPALVPGDRRDLNRDGKIDASDIEILANLCSDCNRPPNIQNVGPSIAILWPPNHKEVAVSVRGVTDPDGDAVRIRIDRIEQDEPTNATGDGDTCPDGRGIGSETALIRAERNAAGNGRVYRIRFTASDSRGASAGGTVSVCVPRDAKGTCVEDTRVFQSTTCGSQ